MLKVGLSRVAVVLLVPLVAPLVAVVTPPQGTSVFHSGTRLVEIEVVVRGKPAPPSGFREFLKSALDSGPPFGPPGAVIDGLTKDDFQLFDDGKAQPISLFQAGPSGDSTPALLPPGAVSNRLDSSGRPLNGVTVVLADFLDSDFDLSGYDRLGLTNLIRGFAETDAHVAVYSLGQSLHILHDFTDDPKKLKELAAQMDRPKRQRSPELSGALRDYGDILAQGGEEEQSVAGQIHSQMTVKALSLIIQHLSGMPGRKNLVWLMPAFYRPPGPVMAMAQRANVTIYPVVIRCPASAILECQQSTRDLAAATGAGRGFYDALDLPFALRTAEEESRTSYILGFYPFENQLDGKFHRIVVKLKNPKLVGAYEVRYRTGYLATKAALPTLAPSPLDLFEAPVDSTGIGLAAQAKPDLEHPGMYEISVTLDLHDIHLDSRDGHFTGGFDLSIPNPSTKHTVKTITVPLSLTENQLSDFLKSGLRCSLTGVEPQSGEIRVMVRDRATGVAGSLRISLAKP